MRMLVSQVSPPLAWLAHKLEALFVSWPAPRGVAAETDEATLAALVGPVPF
ncbi:MAG: hypothetical protein JSS20_02885 [Proteobacteria bacterium]|nr:hypothetical protein [Pseudomonadota bacterium]